MKSGNFSVAVVVGGCEQPERSDGVVVLGFGTEYTLRFRTHDGRRAVANVWIDNIEITGGGLIIPSRGFVDLETPPSTPGQRFRFASTSSDAANAAGKEGPDEDGTKGLIVVDFQGEDRPKSRQHTNSSKYVKPPVPTSQCSTMDFEASPTSSINKGNLSDLFLNTQTLEDMRKWPLADGVTVAGSSSAQRFDTMRVTTDGVVVTMRIKLMGTSKAAYAGRYCNYCGIGISSLSNRCDGCGRRVV